MAKEKVKVVPWTRYADQSNLSGLAYLIKTELVAASEPIHVFLVSKIENEVKWKKELTQ